MQASAAIGGGGGYLFLCTMHEDAVPDEQSDGWLGRCPLINKLLEERRGQASSSSLLSSCIAFVYLMLPVLPFM